jgi:UPF0271 protein
MLKINLNADLGEGFGAYTMGNDAALLGLVNSANIACGFHAGDPVVMKQTVAQARTYGVSLGAHPAFPDLQGFGRRRMAIPHADIYAMVAYQIGALQAIAATEGQKVSHVKPHGALNNMACEDQDMAQHVAQAVYDVNPDLILLAPALSYLAAAGDAVGLRVALEAFADRTYQHNGLLAPRQQKGAVLHHPEDCKQHVLAMLKQQGLITVDGAVLPTPIHSICVHGDGAMAVASATAIRDALREAGYALVALPDIFLSHAV